MDLGLREWIWIISATLMISVVGHGLWVRYRQRNTLKLQIDRSMPAGGDGANDLELLRGELPNGGARVVPNPLAHAPRHRATRQTPTVSLADSPIGDHSVANEAEARSEEPDAEVAEVNAPMSAQNPVQAKAPPSPAATPQPVVTPSEPVRAELNGSERGRSTREARSNNAAAEPSENYGDYVGVEQSEPVRDERRPNRNELVVVHVLCREPGGFPGEQLVLAASKCGLKFGDMNIFHRYRDGKPQKQRIEYSMANAVEPGTFDLAAIHEQATPGVSFFFQMPGPPEPLKTFEDMISVARKLATSLNGDLKDDNMSVMTSQTIEHCRERIKEFNRRTAARA